MDASQCSTHIPLALPILVYTGPISKCISLLEGFLWPNARGLLTPSHHYQRLSTNDWWEVGYKYPVLLPLGWGNFGACVLRLLLGFQSKIKTQLPIEAIFAKCTSWYQCPEINFVVSNWPNLDHISIHEPIAVPGLTDQTWVTCLPLASGVK